ncbi:hypothetical protein [Photobacterium rosenbergii]|uniref:Uncharacterized protein n=1 Tax=Photobacterium rosenbergii TaxID=294936 RepID=A0A2T3N7V8_9GAMM|nr:hypothetical protein [Photobacterium rosenbergii]MBY5945066.1 hypothetical protein [Photobacterium rosenbergii]PSW09200.1 hypothetical protein C9J01_21480 [Photobacterium rosenbergii]
MNKCQSIFNIVDKIKKSHWKNDTSNAIANDVEKLIIDLEPYKDEDKTISHLSFLLKDLLEVLSIDYISAEDQRSASILLIDEITAASNCCCVEHA